MRLTPWHNAAAALLAFACALAPAAEPDADAVVQAIYAGTNAVRADAGRAAVSPAPALEATARDFAQYMADTGRYGHEADGRTPADRARAHGYAFCIVTENIAYRYRVTGYTTRGLATAFVEGWQASPPHRRNMLDPAVTDTGAAVARSSRNGYHYAVQLFGLPASAAARFTIVNGGEARIAYTIGGRRFELAPRATATHTRCRPSRLIFSWPGGGRAAVEPSDGARYVVSGGSGGAWRVEPRP